MGNNPGWVVDECWWGRETSLAIVIREGLSEEVTLELRLE